MPIAFKSWCLELTIGFGVNFIKPVVQFRQVYFLYGQVVAGTFLSVNALGWRLGWELVKTGSIPDLFKKQNVCSCYFYK